MKNIPKPSPEQVKYYLDLWKKSEEYFLSEKSLNKLFLETYPKNNCLEEIITKVCALDVVYSANAGRWFFEVSKNIEALKDVIDEKLGNGELDIVDSIAKIKTSKGKSRVFYSFATKYCSRHKPEYYPIYDSYVEKVLSHFKREDKFMDFSMQSLKDYSVFKKAIQKFREYYCLTDYSLKEVDVYLWLLGKEYFPNYK